MLVVAALLGSLIQTPPDAAAMSFGSSPCRDETVNNCYSMQPSHLVRVYFQDVSGAMKLATLDSMADDYTPTELWMWEVADQAYANVVVKEGEYGQSGYAAWVNCPVTSHDEMTSEGRTCTPQVLKYNRANDPILTQYYDGPESKASIACHELGHTVGLDHSQSAESCMLSGDPDGSTVLRIEHDVADHINPHYATPHRSHD